jgi:hypothetical protein
MGSQGAAGTVQKLRYEDLTKEIIGAARAGIVRKVL